MNIYLAGPMRGYPGQNHATFHQWAAKLRAAGHTVFSPAEHSPADAEESEERIRALLGLDMAWITAVADAVALLPGWERSRGALAEQAVARAIGIMSGEVETFL